MNMERKDVRAGRKEKLPPPLLRLMETSERVEKERADMEIAGTRNGFQVSCEEGKIELNLFQPSLATNNPNAPKAVRWKSMLQKDRSCVVWRFRINDNDKNTRLPEFIIRFKYLPLLDIVVADAQFCCFESNQISDLMLRPENILHLVKKDDYGFANPNTRSSSVLQNPRLECFKELAFAVGFPYRWVQEMCGLRVEHKRPGFTSVIMGGQQNCPLTKFLQEIVNIVFTRLRNLVDSWKDVRATERRILSAKDDHFPPWVIVDRDELLRLFKMEESWVPIELSESPDRIFMRTYNRGHFEVRVAAILQPLYPLEIPVLELAVMDKRQKLGPPKFVSHRVVSDMVTELNADRLSSASKSPWAQILQLIRLSFYVDELIEPLTFEKIASPMVSSSVKTRIPRNTESTPGSMQPVNEAASESQSSSRKRKSRSVTVLSTPKSLMKEREASKKAKKARNSLLKDFISSSEANDSKGSKKKGPSFASSKSKHSQRPREPVVDINESAMMDMNDVKPFNMSQSQKCLSNPDLTETVPWIQCGVEGRNFANVQKVADFKIPQLKARRRTT